MKKIEKILEVFRGSLYNVGKANSKIKLLINKQIEQHLPIIQRIKVRVYEYLIESEQKVLLGSELSNYFENNKEFVISELIRMDGSFKDLFDKIDNHLLEKDANSYSEALLDIRRIFCKYADFVMPAQKPLINCPDDQQRSFTEDKYLNRIMGKLHDKVGEHTHIELLNTNMDDLSKRLKEVNNLSSKGVHNSVSEMEANQCVIQMYVILGDIIRIMKA